MAQGFRLLAGGVVMVIESPHESPLLEDEYDKVKAHMIANGQVERVE
jgi:hypothetical protein